MVNPVLPESKMDCAWESELEESDIDMVNSLWTYGSASTRYLGLYSRVEKNNSSFFSIYFPLLLKNFIEEMSELPNNLL